MATVIHLAFSHSGRHIPGVGLGMLLALAPLTATYAQEELAGGLDECAALSADAERLACFDRLQRGAEQPDDERSEVDQSDADTAAELPEAEPTAERIDDGVEIVQAAEPAEPAEPAETAETAEETSRRPFWRRLRDRLARRGADTVDSSDSETVARSADTEPDEQPVNEPPADDAIEVTVVDVRRNLSGFAVFLTEDNGTWVQISTRDRTYPETPFSARITGGLMGGRFLTPESGGIAVRVRGPD